MYQDLSDDEKNKSDFYLFNLFLFNNLFKVAKFIKIQYVYTHDNSQTSWLIKVNYLIL